MSAVTANPEPPAAPPRGPAIVNLVAALVVVALVAAIALTTRQTPPPTIAEFAPQAIEQIEESLTEDAPAAAEAVAAPGAEPTPEPTVAPSVAPSDAPTPGATEAPIEEPRVRKCVGDPPRQTEDPQSPPCVPYFDGENLGATSQGVTADEIRIAWPNLAFLLPEDPVLVQLLMDHFNRRYEFYGRKMVLVEYSANAFGAADAAAMVADAVKVDEELDAFASLGYGLRDGAEQHYYDELARRGVISSIGLAADGTEAKIASQHPYQWSTYASLDAVTTLGADFVCTNLAGRPPQGGTWAIAPTERRFGVVSVRAGDGTVADARPFVALLEACGQDVVFVEDDIANLQANNVILQMQNADPPVTTVTCFCANVNTLRNDYFGAATNNGYFPEWLTIGYGAMDADGSYTQEHRLQSRSVFGVMVRDRHLIRQQMPWYWAIREGDPTFDRVGNIYYSLHARYIQMLQLASGIQLAGPNLTPETFAAGLQAATFPNPGADGPPQWQAAFDYAGRHTARDTAAAYWYSPDLAGAVDPSNLGTVCHVDGGKRYGLGEFPSEPLPMFEGDCIR